MREDGLIEKCINILKKNLRRLEDVGREIEDVWQRYVAWRAVELWALKSRHYRPSRDELLFISQLTRDARLRWDTILGDILSCSANIYNAVRQLEELFPSGSPENDIVERLSSVAVFLTNFPHLLYSVDDNIWSIGEKIVLLSVGATYDVFYEGSVDDALRSLNSQWNAKLSSAVSSSLKTLIGTFREKLDEARLFLNELITKTAKVAI